MTTLVPEEETTPERNLRVLTDRLVAKERGDMEEYHHLAAELDAPPHTLMAIKSVMVSTGNCRFTRSAGCGKAASHTVVQRLPPRITPCISSRFINRSTVQRTTCHVMAFSLKLTPDLPGAVHLVILIPHAIDHLR